MKVCKDHIKVSGIPKRYLIIVPKTECTVCGLDRYFNDPKNPNRKTVHQIIEMYRNGRNQGKLSGATVREL